MSIKTNLLIAASVMSVVYITGVSNIANAVDQPNIVANNAISQLVYMDTSTDSVIPPANAAGQHRYIIRFKEPAVAQYDGAGESAAIPRNSDNSIQVGTPAVQAYVALLKQQQNAFLTSVSSTLGRPVTALLSYQYAYNGMAVYLAKDEVNSVMSSTQVVDVILDRDYILNTDVGPQLIGADNVWLGTSPAAGTALGEGVVIGILDSGINFDHPSFADVGSDGYDHTNPLGVGNFLGVCDSTNTDQFIAAYTCNDKLIGGFDFINSLITPADGTDLPGPEDEDGHGSHVAATAGGNVVTDAEIHGITGITVSGVAPHANVIMYDVCFLNTDGNARCSGAASVAAVDQILADGIVDVINFSISGGISPWADPASLAFLSATDSGIFVATSAGNSGPGPGTLGHVEPWTSSSGSSTHSRRFFNAANITGPGTIPTDLTNIFTVQGTGPDLTADMVGTINYAGIVDAANANGCDPFAAAAFDGIIALISRGGCSFADKVNNAAAAGATGVIVHNNIAGAAPFVMGSLEATTISSVMIEQVAGDDMVTFITANPTATVSVDVALALDFTGTADSMAGTSSRGPSPFEYNKPDVTAPGVRILAAFSDSDVTGGTPAEYGVISGTSMASPHNAGSAALLKELNPSWSSSEIKSALMMTAVTAGVTKEDAVTPADPFDRGSGRVQVDVASSTGLVMNETAFKFLQADPDNGGDPKTLNVPNLTNYTCIGSCTFQRKFTSVATVSVDYTASLTGMTGTVSPAAFTVNPGDTITLNIEVDGTALTEGVVSFGELVIAPSVPVIASVSVNPGGTAIVDNAYDGSLGTMTCETLTVSGAAGSTVATATLEVGIDHTWVGDLVIKLQNPDGDILGVLSRAATPEANDDGAMNFAFPGDSSNMLATSPVLFSDTASITAESLGSSSGSTNSVVCLDDGICEFSPAPDSVAVPPATLTEMVTGTNDGVWNICVGDANGGDTGTIDSVTLNLLGVTASVPVLHLPAVIIGFPEQPDIDVTPISLSATLQPDATVDQILTVNNTPIAGADLNWDFAAVGTSFVDVFAEQAVNGTGPIASSFFTLDNGGVYSADDFVLSKDSSIDSLFFAGFVHTGTLADTATAVEVRIFDNLSGTPMLPDGHPEDGSTPVASLTIPIADASLDLTDNNILIDVAAANGGATIDLAAGTYWISVFPVINSTGFTTSSAPRWNWIQGTMVGTTEAVLIDPSSILSLTGGFLDWTEIGSGIGLTHLVGLNYAITGTGTCGAAWLSMTPTSGLTIPDSNTDVTVTFDSTGLAFGDYTATLCIDSDDPNEPQVFVPVTMTVEDGDLIFANGFEL